MINMQQSILSQTPDIEQPQEEVQLTELVPVKQSRIRENGIFKDGEATDALKVLRSFSNDCTDERPLDPESFNFGGGIKKQESRLRRRTKGKNTSDNSDSGRKGGSDDRESDKEAIKQKDHGVSKRSLRRRKAFKRKIIQAIKSKVASAEEPRSPNEAANEKHTSEDEDEILSESDDDTGSAYLDLDKSKDLNDEIYVFRREDSDACSTSDHEAVANLENADDACGKDYSTTDGALFDHTASRKDGKAVSDDKENEASPESAVGGKSALENTEKELSRNIDAIIQKSYLLERENNNVVEANQNKTRRSTTNANSPSLPTPSEGSSSADNEQIDPKKRLLDMMIGPNIRKETPEKKFSCIVCNARFKGTGGLRNHYRILHAGGPTYKCDDCGKEFPLKERLRLHIRTHTGYKPYKCPECGKSFARGGQLVQHRRTHSKDKPYQCALCAGTFSCAANLALHVKRHNGQKDHKCELCGRAFVRRDALKKHLECLHQDVKSFLCVICNKTFKGHLPQHMRTHAHDRPHGCATCGQRFAQKSQLTVHQRTHSGQRPFRCLVCWQAFAHSTALKLHTRRHTGERPFKCSECNAGFTQLPHWKKHMKCIHGRNEPYACKRCKSFFRIKNDLESHEKTCHPEVTKRTEKVAATSSEAPAIEGTEKSSTPTKYKVMTVERMRLLLAVLLKRISRQERLDELGFGKRLIDEVLQESLVSAGKDPVSSEGRTEFETLKKNLEIFLEWTVPKQHWENFRKLKKTPEEILETLTAT